MGEVDERLIKSALTLPPASAEPSVEIVGPDGSRTAVPATVGVFYAVNALGAQMQQLSIRLDALHHHLANPEKKAKDNRESCLVCEAQRQAVEHVQRQAVEDGEKAVAEAVGLQEN